MTGQHPHILGRMAAGLVALGISGSAVLAACAPAAAPAAPAPQAAATPRPAAQTTPAPQPTQVVQPRYGGTLSVVAIADPDHLDAQQTGSINTSILVAPAYNNLVYLGSQEGDPTVAQPDLAEKWDVSNGGLTYTFKIRQGVRFHDGAPLTANDVVFNLRRMKSPPKGVQSNVAYALVAVDKIDAVGNDTVVVTMKQPFAPFMSNLLNDQMPMYSKAYVEKQGDMKATVMGTGPFKFKSYTPSASFELVKNDDYWVKGRPYLDGISFAIIKDPATRLAALRTGRAQLSGRVFGALTPTEASTLKKDAPDFTFSPSPSVIGPFLFMNMRVAPFTDPRVRKAVFLAVDRQAAIKIIAQGDGLLGNYFPIQGWGVPPEELGKMPGFRQPKDQDIAEARRLLSEAGFPNGFSLKLLSRNNEVTKTAAIFAADQLSKIGVTATVEVLEDAVFWDTGGKGQQQATVFTPAVLTGDPSDIGRNIAPGSPRNFTGNDKDPKLNELWDKQMSTVDEKARRAVVQDLERYLLTEEVPAVPLVWPISSIAVSPRVHGFTTGVTDYANNRHQRTWLTP